MKQKNYWFAILVALALSACALTEPSPAPTLAPNLPASEAEVPRVSVEEAQAAVARGEAIIVDVRGADYYAASHVAGALSLPLTRIEEDPANVSLDKTKWIITYCT